MTPPDTRPESRRRPPSIAWRNTASAHEHLQRMPDIPAAGALLIQGWVAS